MLWVVFESHNSQERRQNAGVLLRVDSFVLVDKEYVDLVTYARPHTPDHQLLCDLVDLETSAPLTSNVMIVVFCAPEPANVDRHCSAVLRLQPLFTDLSTACRRPPGLRRLRAF